MQSSAETCKFKTKKKFWNGIEIQIPATDPVLQGMLKRILANQEKMKERLRNLERISDGNFKIGVGTFKMLPINKNVEQDDYIVEDE